jgi:GntR family transcriptional regulator
MVRKNISLTNQLVFEILAQIDSGEIVSDNKVLPSEAELTQRFGVSRATVREALAKLELGGAIVRRHGIGTYVSPMVTTHPGSVRNWLDESPNFLDFIRGSGFSADCLLLNINLGPAAELSSWLDITPATPIVAIERVFRGNGIPVIHSANYVPFDFVKLDRRENLFDSYDCAKTIYEFLQQECSQQTYNQKSEVQAVLADDLLAEHLQCAAGMPLLSVTEVGYGPKMEPLFYGLNRFRGDLVSFVEMRHPAVCLQKPA